MSAISRIKLNAKRRIGLTIAICATLNFIVACAILAWRALGSTRGKL